MISNHRIVYLRHNEQYFSVWWDIVIFFEFPDIYLNFSLRIEDLLWVIFSVLTGKFQQNVGPT